ncbi:MAG: phosphatidate cytidylyltransferase [Desulfomicrobium escambiense]|nr:phosphatidate cytidylyltransferase [Desulfomicrobium escambiense]
MALPQRKHAGFVAAFAGSLLLPALVFEFLPFSFCLTLLVLFVRFFPFSESRISSNLPEKTGLLLLGFLYLPLLMSYLVLLREMDHGVKWIFLLLIIVMSGDTAAFYVGSSLGKRKLYPIVSPNKSVEGMIGGLVGSVLELFWPVQLSFRNLPSWTLLRQP